MSFSKPKYILCDECDGEGEILHQTSKWEVGKMLCPLCSGDGKILDEQLPEEQNNEE